MSTTQSAANVQPTWKSKNAEHCTKTPTNKIKRENNRAGRNLKRGSRAAGFYLTLLAQIV